MGGPAPGHEGRLGELRYAHQWGAVRAEDKCKDGVMLWRRCSVCRHCECSHLTAATVCSNRKAWKSYHACECGFCKWQDIFKDINR